MTIYTHTANGRTWRLYGCAKRGCDRISPDYMSFGTKGGKGYCLDHIPRLVKFKMRLKGAG
jgi:hypothetical protein